MKISLVAFVVLTLSVAPSAWAAHNATFSFDTCKPLLTTGMSTAFDQTCSGVKGHFSSTHDGWQGGGYSVQNQNTTGWILHLFSGNYLMPNGLDPGRLDINFNTSLTKLRFYFATADFHQNEVPTTIQMDAYFNKKLVGTVQTHGHYGTDTMPMGTLKYDSKGKAFNRIEIWIPPQPLGTTDVLVDTLVVRTK